jgi:hypothetical protein
MKVDISPARLCLEGCYLVHFPRQDINPKKEESKGLFLQQRCTAAGQETMGLEAHYMGKSGPEGTSIVDQSHCRSASSLTKQEHAAFVIRYNSAQGALYDDASDTITTRAKQIWLPCKGVLPTKNPGKSKQAYMGSSLLFYRRRLFPRNPLHHQPSPITGG